MTAKSDIEAIKNQADLSDTERIWKAIEHLAQKVDDAPDEAGRRINNHFRGL